MAGRVAVDPPEYRLAIGPGRGETCSPTGVAPASIARSGASGVAVAWKESR